MAKSNTLYGIVYVQDTPNLTSLLFVMYLIRHFAELFPINCVNDIASLFSLFFKQHVLWGVGGEEVGATMVNYKKKMTLENSYINFRD